MKTVGSHQASSSRSVFAPRCIAVCSTSPVSPGFAIDHFASLGWSPLYRRRMPARVAEGDTVAIVEVMKLMNHVVAPVAGVVTAIWSRTARRSSTARRSWSSTRGLGGRCALERVLVANRGEIAVRVIRACFDEGLETVLAVSDADREQPRRPARRPHVCIGPASAAESYLDIDRLIARRDGHRVRRAAPRLRLRLRARRSCRPRAPRPASPSSGRPRTPCAAAATRRPPARSPGARHRGRRGLGRRRARDEAARSPRGSG